MCALPIFRAGGLADLDALFGLATMTGGGFTNLPPDRDTLAAKLARSEAAFARLESPPEDELYMLALEAVATGEIICTAQIFSSVGVRWPSAQCRVGKGRVSSVETG